VNEVVIRIADGNLTLKEPHKMVLSFGVLRPFCQNKTHVLLASFRNKITIFCYVFTRLQLELIIFLFFYLHCFATSENLINNRKHKLVAFF
jgi:hypothetical protein